MVPVGRLTLVRTFAKSELIRAMSFVAIPGLVGPMLGPIAGGLIATFTISPALSAILLRGRLSEHDTFIVNWIRRAYRPLLQISLANPILTFGGTGVLLVIVFLAARMLGTEFLPHLEEGNFWIRASMPQAISLEAGTADVREMRRLIKSYPEVVTVISQHGRPDDGTDTTGFFDTEFFVDLLPKERWRPLRFQLPPRQ